MASNQEQVSSLPLPPVQHIGQYTDENVKRGRAPKPPPPIQDTYTMFGRTFNQDDPIIRPLESQGIKRLYPQHPDRRKELKKLNHSLLVNFLDLIDLLVKCPESPRRTEKVDDISILFIHMHHLINEFRPHQARETLRVMLELQCRQRTETTIRYQKHVKKAREMLQQAIDSLPQLEDKEKKIVNKANMVELKQVSESGDKRKQFDADECKVVDVVMCKEADQVLSKRYHKRFKKCFSKSNVKI